jgi:hypothetical protein
VSFGIVAVLAVALSAPIAVYAEDQMLPAEEQVLAPASVPGPSATTTSVEASRVNAAQHVLLSGDLGSLQEETLMAVVAAAPSWDETSGYGAVEASRAGASALLAPVAGPTWDETSGYGAVEASRATNAQQALQSHDLGSMQEEALAAIVAAAISWDDTSGYASVEASRAAAATLLAPVAAPSWDATSGYGAVEASRAMIGHPGL